MQLKFGGVVRRAAIIAATALAATAATAGTASAGSLAETTTSILASPNPAVVGDTVTYSIEVNAAEVESQSYNPPAITGTVSLDVSGGPIAGCQSLPLTDGVATCQGPAGSTQDHRRVDADYSGDDNYAFSTGFVYLMVLPLATVEASVTPNPVLRLAPITYKATVDGINPTSVGTAIVISFGTVAFFVDGEPVAACAAQPVDSQGRANCPSLAPPVRGTHVLRTVFSGNPYAGPNSDETNFVVLAPAVTLPEAVDFASVKPGETSTRTVKLTNSGDIELRVGDVTPEGAFEVTTDGCSQTTLAAGATCDVVVTFRPGAAGTFTGALVFAHDAEGGAQSVALSGTAPADPAPPVTPTPTPTPPPAEPAQPGATLAPGANPMLSVTVPRVSSAPVLSLPLSCPAEAVCLVDGDLKIATSTLSKSARTAAAATRTVARFSRVQVEAGGLKTLKLKLSPAFVKSAQERGIRRIKATLTIHTTFGSGQRVTTRQRVTLLLPRVAKLKPTAPRLKPHFTG